MDTVLRLTTVGRVGLTHFAHNNKLPGSFRFQQSMNISQCTVRVVARGQGVGQPSMESRRKSRIKPRERRQYLSEFLPGL
jgi:hypothetical protein